MTEKKLNILHTESMGIRGGQPMRVIEELKIIAELGHTPHLACRPGTWLESEARKNGIHVVNAPLKRAVDPKSLSILLSYIRRNRIDIVHSHNSKDSYSAWVAAKLSRVPFIRARHSDLIRNKRPGPIYTFADAIVTTGTKIARELSTFGISSEKIVSIPSYPDAERFRPNNTRREKIREKYSISEQQIVLGNLGGYKSGKRAHWILESLYKLHQQFPNIVFLLAGSASHKKYQQEFEAKVEEWDLKDKFRYVEYVDPAEFLDAIDIYICASAKEGVPQTVMQAMLMGKAVISTDVGGIPDLNRENNLLLVPADHPEAMSEVLKNLLDNPQKIQEFAQNNRRLALRYFNREVLKEELDNLYQRVTQ